MAINKANKGTIRCDVRDLCLYLTKQGETWLKDDDDATLQLQNGIVMQDIEAMLQGDEMKASWSIQGWLNEKGMEPLMTRQLHILVLLPEPHEIVSMQSPKAPRSVLDQIMTSNVKCIWLGKVGSNVHEEGVDLKSDKALFRKADMEGIIDRLKMKVIVLVRSPPMTGKTSTAALVNHALFEKHKEGNKPRNVFEEAYWWNATRNWGSRRLT